MCQNRAVNRPAARLSTAALMLSAVNLTLLMPAGLHGHAGVLTQVLPFFILALTVVLLFLAARQSRTGRK